MNPQVLAGFIVGGLIFVGALVVPRMLRSSAAVSADEAADKAAEARQVLETYSHRANEASRLTPADQLKSADFDKLATQSPEWFDEAKGTLNEARQRLAGFDRSAQKHGGGKSAAAPLDATPSGLRTAMGEYDAILRSNAEILDRAGKLAREARQANADVPGVGLVQGSVELVRASERMADSIVIRRQVEESLFELISLSEALVGARAEADALKGLDPAKIVTEGDTPLPDAIRKDIDAFQASRQEAERAASELRERVAAAKAKRDELRKQIDQARSEQLALEQNGFKPGDDAGFESFRRRYADVSARLQQLQEDEHLLSLGGLRGAKIDEGDFESGEITGGEPVEGIDELERKLALAEDQAKRRAAAAATVERSLAGVVEGGKSAAAQLEVVSKHISSLMKRIDETKAALMTVAAGAMEKETEALEAARAADQAFGVSAAAAQKWVSAQSRLKQEMDRSGKNERLKLLLGDTMLVNVGPAAQAQAKLMTGRILLQRAESLAMLAKGLGRVASRVPGFQFDEATLKSELEAARRDALDVLTAAKDGYEAYASASLRPETAWVRKALSAYAFHMLAAANIAPAAAAEFRGRAAAQISEAVKGAERTPWLAWHVAFRDHLVSSGAAPEPETPAPSEDEEAQQPGSEGGG